MSNILTIAKREIRRVSSRFRGRSSPFVMFIFVGALAISYLAFQQGLVLAKGLYTVGVSPGGPTLQDSRFNTITIERSVGYAMLADKTIDAYVDGDRVASRNDSRSLYAVGALKQHLEKQELVRIKDEYEIDRAFPLRVEVNYLDAPTESAITQGVPLSELLATWPMADSSGQPSAIGHQPTDSAVRERVREMERDSPLSVKMEFASDQEIIIPSLMNPPIPFAQVIMAFFYVLPVSFISVFFTSSFMDEKTGRRLTVLMSAPVTPFEIIAGKMLPYVGFSLLSVVIITVLLQGNLVLAMAIFTPIILFIFAIYLMVSLLYRTFRDTTFISMLAITTTTSYLIFPAMFSGVNDLSYMSPLTLAVRMYRGEPFGLKEYLFSTAPMYFIFLLSMYIGTRILNEEYLMGFRPLYRKVADALYFTLDRRHLSLSIALLSLFLIPIVYMIQLVALAMSFNLPLHYAAGGLLVTASVVEEVAKSAGIVVLLENRLIRSTREVLVLSFLSALGFLIGEKLLLYISLSVVLESVLSAALFSSGFLLIPLMAHFGFTAAVCLLVSRLGARFYPFAILAGATAHSLYNLYVLGVIT